jgi:thiamine-phosphate pyrophosphorylase
MGDELARARLARAASCLNRKQGRKPGRTFPSLIFLTDDRHTPEPARSARALPRGSLVIVRATKNARRVALATAIGRIAKERDLYWLIADDPLLAVRAGADGAHFPEASMGEAHHWRALRSQWFITCAAHSLAACARIARTGANAALLAPVFATDSHVGAATLGPARLHFIAGQSPVPVYALGGIDEVTARRLRDADLAGLAAVSALSC